MMRSRARAVLLGTCGLGAAYGGTSELYSTNAICRQNSCINPLFPGLNDMPRLEQLQWQCATNSQVRDYMTFCRDAVVYDTALPSPNTSTTAVKALVESQDAAAVTMYFYHLSAMGYDAQEHEAPEESTDTCVRSVWEMVCYTYFPRSEAGCTEGQASFYLRPCQTSCLSYLEHCHVECCDESAACVFSHNEDVNGVMFTQTGYVNYEAPSSYCTGTNSGRRSAGVPSLLLLALLGVHVSPGAIMPGKRFAAMFSFLALAVSLQGCNVDVPKHDQGNWREKDDYLIEYDYIPPGGTDTTAVLNSCQNPDLTASQQCSGRGWCKAWDTNKAGAISFCQCDRDYADPECRTKRKSQTKAFLYSLLLGWLGADYYYLGYPVWALFKMVTLGGLGSWWLFDVVRTGSGNVYAANFRTSPDLPHWLFVVTTVAGFMIIGFVWGISSYLSFRRKKRANVMKVQESEEFRTLSGPADYSGLSYRGTEKSGFEGPRGFSGYGATLPVPLPNAGAPYAVPPSLGHDGRFAGPYGPAGYPGAGSA